MGCILKIRYCCPLTANRFKKIDIFIDKSGRDQRFCVRIPDDFLVYLPLFAHCDAARIVFGIMLGRKQVGRQDESTLGVPLQDGRRNFIHRAVRGFSTVESLESLADLHS